MGQLTKEAEADGSQTPGGNANNTAALLTYTTALILCDSSLWQQAGKDGIAVSDRSSVNLLATGYSQDLQDLPPRISNCAQSQDIRRFSICRGAFV